MIFIGALYALLVFGWNIKSPLNCDLFKGVNKFCGLLWNSHWGAQIDIFLVKFRKFISRFVFFKRSTHWYRGIIPIVPHFYWLWGAAVYLFSEGNFNIWIFMVTCLIYYIIIGCDFIRFWLFLRALICNLKWLISFGVSLLFLSLAHKTRNIRPEHVIVNFNPIFELI